jgi:hypothetical protein
MSETVVIKRQRRWLEVPCKLPEYRVFHKGELRVFVGRDLHVDPGGWCLSISHKRRYPTWEEVKHARREFIPLDVTMAIVVPETEESGIPYFYCFYLRQVLSEDELNAMRWKP